MSVTVTKETLRVQQTAVDGRESSGIGGIGEDATVVPLWTTTTEAVSDDDSRSPCGGGGDCGWQRYWIAA